MAMLWEVLRAPLVHLRLLWETPAAWAPAGALVILTALGWWCRPETRRATRGRTVGQTRWPAWQTRAIEWLAFAAAIGMVFGFYGCTTDYGPNPVKRMAQGAWHFVVLFGIAAVAVWLIADVFLSRIGKKSSESMSRDLHEHPHQ